MPFWKKQKYASAPEPEPTPEPAPEPVKLPEAVLITPEDMDDGSVHDGLFLCRSRKGEQWYGCKPDPSAPGKLIRSAPYRTPFELEGWLGATIPSLQKLDDYRTMLSRPTLQDDIENAKKMAEMRKIILREQRGLKPYAPVKQENRSRNRQIAIRLNEREFSEFQRLVDACGQTQQAFIKQAIFAERQAGFSADLIDVLAQICTDLNETIKQLVRVLNDNPETKEELAATIRMLTGTKNGLNNLMEDLNGHY